MKKGEPYQTTLWKIIVPLLIVNAIIIIFKGGYHTGQWLYTALHP